MSIAQGPLVHALYVIMLTCTFAYSLKYGDRPEKYAAWAFVAVSVVSGLVVYHKRGAFGSLEQGLFAIDVFTWAGLL